jgi:hypothetical protein
MQGTLVFEYSIICNTTPTQHLAHKKTKPLMTGLVLLGARGVFHSPAPHGSALLYIVRLFYRLDRLE